MKKILFFSTNRVHMARQEALLEAMRKLGIDVAVDDFNIKPGASNVDAGGTMARRSLEYANGYLQVIEAHAPDMILVRGDRFEMLPVAMLAAYSGIPIAHIEGGDLSGAIDNKVRHSITQLADLHFVTNSDSHSRVIAMGANPARVFNFGSLDVEFAMRVDPGSMEHPLDGEPYIVHAFHPVPGEEEDVLEWIRGSVGEDVEVVTIRPNGDYGRGEAKGTEFSNEKYLQLLYHAKCLVGNSSSFIKEASVYGTPVLDVGSRQANRLKPRNVFSVPYGEQYVRLGTRIQFEHDRYPLSEDYYHPQTSLKIAQTILKFL